MNIQKTLIFFIGISFSLVSFGQEAGLDSLQVDEVWKQTNSTIDSLSHSQWQDSLKTTTSSLDSIQFEVNNKLDSITNLRPNTSTLDSAKQAVQGKIDSLKALELPHEQYVKKLDSLNKVPTNYVNQKVSAGKQWVSEKTDQVKNKITGKVSESGVEGVSEKLSDTDVNLPDAKLDGLETNLGIDESIPDQSELGLDLDDKIDVPDQPGLNKVTDKVDEVSGLPEEKLGELKDKTTVGEVNSKLDKVGQSAEEIGGIQEDIAKARQGDTENLEKRAEEEALKQAEMQELQKQSQQMDKLKQEHEAYKKHLEEQQGKASKYADPDFVKQRLKEKSKHIANDDLLKQYQSKIKVAQLELATADMPKVDLDTLKNTREKIKKPNPLTGSPLKERIRPGILMEINRQENSTSLDLAPSLAYRLNDKWKVYAAYLYRIHFNNDDRAFGFDDHIYGPRMTSTYEFYKGFYVKTTLEQIRTSVPRDNSNGEFRREWVKGAYLGVGRQYAFSRKVLGNVQVMYNFLYNEDSPYGKKFNIRFGFDIDLNKKGRRHIAVPKSLAKQELSN